MAVLYVNIGGTWVPISTGGGTGTDEVWIGTDDPIAANPTIELWYDSDAAATLPLGKPSVIYRNIDLSSLETGDITTSPWGIVVVDLALLAGHHYRVECYGACVCRAASGASSGYFFLTIAGVNVNSKDAYMASPNIARNGDVTYVHYAGAGGTVNFAWKVQAAWYSGAIRLLRGAGYPNGLVVTDLG